jgi:hypothetical protein
LPTAAGRIAESSQERRRAKTSALPGNGATGRTGGNDPNFDRACGGQSNTIHLHRTRPDSLREHWRLRDAVEQFSYMRLSTRSASPLTAAIASTVESP